MAQYPGDAVLRVPARPEPRDYVRPDPLTLGALRTQAHELLDPLTVGYLESGAADQVTLSANEGDFGRIRLAPHVLRDVTGVTTTTQLFGRAYESPVFVAPTGSHGLFHPEAELATAAGADMAASGMVLSAYSNTGIEHVAARTRSGLWMQVNPPPSRSYLENLVDRVAEYAEALVVTVDTPVVGTRESQLWDGITLPDGLGFPMLDGLHLETESGGGIYRSGLDAAFDASSLEWLVRRSRLPVVVKGVLRGDDAKVAIGAGAAGVIISNHGGRNLDSGRSTMRALPEVADAVQGQVPVLLDGGVRRGTDVLKAVALGADAVLVGRPVLWGLTVGGAEGVAAVLELVRRELAMAMALCGVNSVEHIGPDLLDW
ncbi:alpha-hydroxy-acid oxidizing protein [Nocardioidaceae bacterium SCSIO 66511]|nr:alpha-hydroxy-acid oxidizing protein [Nocardioidaceae bacterium SCSIO 66511]